MLRGTGHGVAKQTPILDGNGVTFISKTPNLRFPLNLLELSQDKQSLPPTSLQPAFPGIAFLS